MKRALVKNENEWKETLALIHESVRNKPLLVEEAGKQKSYLPEESESDIFIQEGFLDEDEDD
jgi:hypothetical protein